MEASLEEVEKCKISVTSQRWRTRGEPIRTGILHFVHISWKIVFFIRLLPRCFHVLSRALTPINKGDLCPVPPDGKELFFVCPFALASFPQAPTGKGDEF